jgi:hypothetical protein
MFIDDTIRLLSIIKDPYEATFDYIACYVSRDKRARLLEERPKGTPFAGAAGGLPTRGRFLGNYILDKIADIGYA